MYGQMSTEKEEEVELSEAEKNRALERGQSLGQALRDKLVKERGAE